MDLLQTSLDSIRQRAGQQRQLMAGLVLSFLAPQWFWAQTLDEDIFQLPAFEVEIGRDSGYLSTNAISGTSLNMAIRDLPVPLEVINQELIEDLQASDLKEALAYSSGVFTQSFASDTGANATVSRERSPSSAASVNNPFTNTISIRGYAVPNQQRFGFRVGSIAVGEGFSVVLGGITDTSNIERMEVVRGPASLLYGVNVLSGVVNILPREPLMEWRGRTQITAGSYDYFRSSAEYTGPIVKDKLAFRISGAFEDRGHYTDFRSDELEYLVGQLKWQPFPHTNLLVEVQHSDSTRYGIGPSFFTDQLSGQEIDKNPPNTTQFRNPYYEHIRFGYDLPDDFLVRDDQNNEDIWLIHKDDPLVPQENAHLGENYRISGPDSYFTREEFNALALLRSNPVRHLNLEIGAYYTRVEQEQFRPNLRIFSNSEGPISTQPNQRAPSSLLATSSNINFWVRNPEVLALFGGSLPESIEVPGSSGPVITRPRIYPIDQAVGFSIAEGDIPNFISGGSLANITSGGIGEVFIVPDMANRRRPGGNPEAYNWNNKLARYYWTKEPSSSESIQLRTRVAYDFEADLPALLGGPSRHILTGGVQYIEDEISISSAVVNPANTVTYGAITKEGNQFTGLGRLAEDPYILRSSVFDYTPIRYNGETLAIPGSLRINREGLGDTLFEDGIDNGFRIARSGLRDVKAFYRGAYMVYQGHFWEERITFIGGLRHDSYQILESEKLRVLDGDPNPDPARNTTVTDFYQGTGGRVGSSPSYSVTPYLVGTGDRPYTRDQWIPDLPDTLNEEVARQIDLLREGLGDSGTTQRLFPEAQTFDTRTAGISFRLAEPLSLYLLYSEGVFPNQGQRDGLDRPIDAEETSSREIGLKFDLFESKVSGTISFFQLRRDNATWDFPDAPSPRRWVGGRLGQPEEAYQPWTAGTPLTFDARSYLSGDGVEFDIAVASGADPNKYQRQSYGVIEDFVREVWREQTGADLPTTLNQQLLDNLGLDFVFASGYLLGGNPQFENRDRASSQATFFWVDVERDLVPGKHVTASGVDLGLLMKEAFDRAMAARDFDGFPIAWTQINPTPVTAGVGNNPSNRTGDLVTFSEEALGVDGQIIFSPTSNYQIITTFSWQKREVVDGGFQFVPLIDPVSGETIPGTAYDRWVYILGKEAFDDPTDPTSHNGIGVDGLDLSFVPQWNFSLWNKYRFDEGALEGLEVLGGVRYYGEAPTAVAIGSRNATDNRYPTPPTKERTVFDLGLNYSFDLSKTVRVRLALKIDNLFDDRIGENTVTYQDLEDPGRTQTRRSRVVYAPRTWRLSATLSF